MRIPGVAHALQRFRPPVHMRSLATLCLVACILTILAVLRSQHPTAAAAAAAPPETDAQLQQPAQKTLADAMKEYHQESAPATVAAVQRKSLRAASASPKVKATSSSSGTPPPPPSPPPRQAQAQASRTPAASPSPTPSPTPTPTGTASASASASARPSPSAVPHVCPMHSEEEDPLLASVWRPPATVQLPLPLPLPSASTISSSKSTTNTTANNTASGSRDVAKPLYVMFGNVDSWSSYLSSQYFSLFRTLLLNYDWKGFEPTAEAATGAPRPLPTCWADVRAYLVQDFGRLPAVVLMAEPYWWWERLGSPRESDAAANCSCNNSSSLNVTTSSNSSSKSNSSGVLGDVQLWMWVNDLHRWDTPSRQLMLYTLQDAHRLYSPYTHKMTDLLPELAHVPRTTLPHSATRYFQLHMNRDPVPRVLLSGNVQEETYPYRARVAAKIAAGDTRFVLHPHPGWKAFNPGRDEGVGASYACTLHRYLAGITDGTRFNYTIAKLVEIPATGALLLANSELEEPLAAMGMHPWQHYVPYTAETLDAVTDAVLSASNRPAVDTIRAQGQALVWSRHMVHHRANQLHAAAEAVTAAARDAAAAAAKAVGAAAAVVPRQPKPTPPPPPPPAPSMQPTPPADTAQPLPKKQQQKAKPKQEKEKEGDSSSRKAPPKLAPPPSPPADKSAAQPAATRGESQRTTPPPPQPPQLQPQRTRAATPEEERSSSSTPVPQS